MVFEVRKNDTNCPVFLKSKTKKTKYKHILTPLELDNGRRANLRGILNLSRTLNITFIVMHGSLLGWSFNQKLLPWDEDLDISYFYENHNKLVEFATKKQSVGPSTRFYQQKKYSDHIEFRIKHDPSGVYTDMTSLQLTTDPKILRARVISKPRNLKPPLYAMKSSFFMLWGGHLYRPEDIVPLSKCKIHDIPLYCPHTPHNVLIQEYRNYKSRIYNRWKFNTSTQCWHEKNKIRITKKRK